MRAFKTTVAVLYIILCAPLVLGWLLLYRIPLNLYNMAREQ